jgi:hypothetical protein
MLAAQLIVHVDLCQQMCRVQRVYLNSLIIDLRGLIMYKYLTALQLHMQVPLENPVPITSVAPPGDYKLA